jgi:hypothetical protein
MLCCVYGVVEGLGDGDVDSDSDRNCHWSMALLLSGR